MILNHKIKIIIHINYQLLAYTDTQLIISSLNSKQHRPINCSVAKQLAHYIVYQVHEITLCSLSALSFSKLLSLNLFLLDVSINPAILKSRSTAADEGSAVLNFRNRRWTAEKKCSLDSDLSASDRKLRYDTIRDAILTCARKPT